MIRHRPRLLFEDEDEHEDDDENYFHGSKELSQHSIVNEAITQ